MNGENMEEEKKEVRMGGFTKLDNETKKGLYDWLCI